MIAAPSLAQSSLQPQLQSVDELAASGLPGLALALLDRDQPDYANDPDAWQQWLKTRVSIDSRRGAWSEVSHQLDQYKAQISSIPALIPWADTVAAEVRLAEGDGEGARELLLPLLWSGPASPVDFIRQWRRMVIQSYLNDGRHGDAYTALLRYQQDYSDTDTSWHLLEGQVLLAAARYEDAMVAVSGLTAPKAVAIRLLARSNAGLPLTAYDADQGIASVQGGDVGTDLSQALLDALLQAFAHFDDGDQRLRILEALVAVDKPGVDTSAAAAALWDAYSEYGLLAANRLQLLMGDYLPWFEAATRLSATSSRQARALFAWLALNTGGESSQRAHQQLLESLSAMDDGLTRVRALYLGSGRFAGPQNVPLPVLYSLTDQALDSHQPQLAAKLLNVIEQPDEEGARVDWQLRRAQLQIQTGMAAQGSDLLNQLILDGHSFSPPQMDRYLASVFDLQSRGRDDLVYQALEALLPQVPALSLHRQVLFWMGDAAVRQHKLLDGVRLYLRAADLVEGGRNDEWGQAALYQAAQTLVQAGLVSDALKLYGELIKAAPDEPRRQILQREAQRLSRAQQLAAVQKQ